MDKSKTQCGGRGGEVEDSVIIISNFVDDWQVSQRPLQYLIDR